MIPFKVSYQVQQEDVIGERSSACKLGHILSHWHVLGYEKIPINKRANLMREKKALVVPSKSMLGTFAMVRIASMGRWSVFGEVIETIQPINNNAASSKGMSTQEEYPKNEDPKLSFYFNV
ncbi:hypothetical protein FNV43_RR08801 [Rhamnella rubrinervis]|uniref:Uncharacterized protein n=1 Tax=Rhamnella rubrinervis TaxID=2594499 RepID=A0A8K0HA21_9ROSA|nr:hypothetical protein FNV43_RR08801 [Rhamnella rubrinervis]